MKTLKQLATHHPVVFSLLITLIVLIFYIAAAVLAEIVAQDDASYFLMEALGRIGASTFFLYILWRFGWLKAAGVAHLGTFRAWTVMLIILAYETVFTVYFFFGDFALNISDPKLSVSVGLNSMSTGLIEELPFRGIILYTFVRLWGDSRSGLFKGVLYSSLLFGGSHLIHILFGRPLPQATLVAISTFLSGIYLAALVLHWKSIWTAVLFHGLSNTIIAIKVIETPGFTETIPALSLFTVIQLPVVVYGLFLIFRQQLQPAVHTSNARPSTPTKTFRIGDQQGG
jgi:membrane protease YdiL (CAAX protease family)